MNRRQRANEKRQMSDGIEIEHKNMRERCRLIGITERGKVIERTRENSTTCTPFTTKYYHASFVRNMDLRSQQYNLF